MSQMRWLILPALVFTMACEEEEPVMPAQPTEPPEEAWEYPEFDGDGLPASEDLNHENYDASNDDLPVDPPDGDNPTVTINVQDGLFGWSTYTEGGGNGPLGEEPYTAYRGSLVLLDKSLGCYDLFSTLDSFTPDGIHFQLTPALAEDGSPIWEGEYKACRRNPQPPCYSNGYAYSGGEYGELGQRASITIQGMDPHYLTVDWTTDVSEGQGLKFYNCGKTSNWAY